MVTALSSNREQWVDFMMRFELVLEAPNQAPTRQNALTIALSYIVGGMIPLSPFILLNDHHIALIISVVVTASTILVWIYQGPFHGSEPL